MAAALSRGVISDSEWEAHKETIKQLYLGEGKTLQGSEGVRDTMKRRCGFRATKAQYERRFKKWSFYKNRSRNDWDDLARTIEARTTTGKDSIVYLNGELMLAAKTQRESYRHGYIPAMGKPSQTSIHRTPESLAVLTPEAEDRTPFWTYNLPFIEFEVAFRTKANHATISPLSQNREYVDRWQEFRLETPFGKILLQDSAEKLAYQQLTATYRCTIVPALKSLLPWTAVQDCTEGQLDILPSQDAFSSAYMRLLIFSVANNFAGLDGLPHAKILEYLQSKTNAQFSRFLHSIPGPTSKALAEKLFCCAIEAGDARIVEALLKDPYAGIDANEHICTCKGLRYTSIERSCLLDHVAVTKILIEHGADLNKTFKESEQPKFPYKVGGALPRAFLPPFYPFLPVDKDWRPDPQLVRLILEAGAKILPESLGPVLDCVISSIDAETVNALFLASTLESQDGQAFMHIFRAAFMFLDNEAATSIINIMVQVGADINHCEPDYRDSRSGHWHLHSGKIDTFQRYCGYGQCPGAGTPRVARPRTALDIAAHQGNLDMVQVLLRSGATLTDDTLIRAVQSENMDLVAFLLSAGAIVDSVSVDKFSPFRAPTTPFSEAIRSTNDGLIQLLKKHGALVRIEETDRFRAALEAASEVGNASIVQALIKATARDNKRVLGRGLAAAIDAGHDEVAIALIDAGAFVNFGAENGTPLLGALQKRNIAILRLLLDCSVDLRPYHRIGSPLELAAIWGDYSVIKDLLFAGAEVNAFGRENSSQPPLMIAVEKNDLEMVDILLDAGAMVNVHRERNYRTETLYGKTPLRAAVMNGNTDMVRHLLSRGADPDDPGALFSATAQRSELVGILLQEFASRYPNGMAGYGTEALHHAIGNGDLALIKSFLRHGVDPRSFFNPDRERCSISQTPLASAIEKDNGTSLAEAEILLKSGVDPNSIVYSCCSSRNTALLSAVGTKNTAMVDLLIKHKAEVNFPPKRGVKRTPLQKAAEIGSYDIVQTLLSHDADVNVPAALHGGGTALQLAAIGGYVGIACLLLEKGADVNAPASKIHGRTALEGAAEHGRPDMVQLLVNAGAKTKGPGRQQYESAMRRAKKNGHFATLELLKSYSGPDHGRSIEVF